MASGVSGRGRARAAGRGVRIALFAALLAPGGARAAEDAPAGPGPLVQPARGYVGSNACQSCHPGPYASWHASYHRTMTQAATRGTALGDFDGVELQLHGESYRLGHSGDALWVEIGRPGRRVRRPIVLSTGSHHDQMYWYAIPGPGRRLLQLPFDWSRRLGRWIPTEMSFLQPGEHRTPVDPDLWSYNCSGCHSTHPDPGLAIGPDGAKRMDTTVAELGIACEACHGPGEAHVALNRDPARRYRLHLEASGDASIANPRQLSHERSSEVCGQCHGIRFHHTARATYRPGDALEEHAVVVRHALRDPEHPQRARPRERALFADLEQDPTWWSSLFWGDGMVRVSGREYTGMRESGCFLRGEISCLSCHSLHQQADDPRAPAEWANDQVAVGMQGNAACTQCHPALAEPAALGAHTHHAPESSGSLCYDCHMPHTGYGIQKAHRSHLISSPSARESRDLGRPNACNQCHLDRTLGWTADALTRWYAQPALELSRDEREVAAAVLWALRGDAGQRALMAWSFGWAPAQEASGADWTPFYLMHLLDDPYASVRFIAHLSLRDRSDFAGWSYDFSAGPKRRRAAIAEARQRWEQRGPARAGAPRPALLLDAAGRPDPERFRRLAAERDDTPIFLAE